MKRRMAKEKQQGTSVGEKNSGWKRRGKNNIFENEKKCA
jgi:hypothetical protein